MSPAPTTLTSHYNPTQRLRQRRRRRRRRLRRRRPVAAHAGRADARVEPLAAEQRRRAGRRGRAVEPVGAALYERHNECVCESTWASGGEDGA